MRPSNRTVHQVLAAFGLCAVLALLLPMVVGCRRGNAESHLKRGNALAEQHKVDDAILEYRQAVRLDPHLGEARYRLALALLERQDPGQAMAEAVRAADVLPERADVQLLAGNLLLAAGQYDDAKARAEKVLASDLKNADALILLGNASLGLKQFDKALEEYERAAQAATADGRAQTAIGVLQQMRGNAAEAELAFANAVKVAPQSTAAQLALANYYWSAGKLDQAADAISAALRVTPNDATANRAMALFHIGRGEDAKAEPYLRTALSSAPGDLGARFVLADLLVREKRSDEAISLLEAVALGGSAFSLAVAKAAVLDYSAGRHDAALARLDRALKQRPRDTTLLAAKGRLLLSKNDAAQAAEVARLALSLEANHPDALFVAGSAALEEGRVTEAVTLLERAAAANPRAVGPQLQLVRAYLVRGSGARALEYANAAVTLDPRSPLARVALIRALAATGNVGGAEVEWKALSAVAPESPQVLALAGNLALLRKDRPAARKAFTRAIEADPNSVDALAGLVRLDLSEGRRAEALALVDARNAGAASDPDLVLLAARTYSAAGDIAKAETALKRLIRISPARLEAYEALAGLYVQQQRLDEARQQFEAAAQRDPSAAGPATMIGVILQLQGKPQEAQAAYERLLAANPDAPIAANNLAMLLVESGGNLDVALNYAQAAKKALPNDADVSDTLGLVYLRKGLGSLAVSAFEQSTAANPKEPTFWWHLGQACLMAGDKAKAREALTRALSIAPDFAGAAEARKALVDLGRKSATE